MRARASVLVGLLSVAMLPTGFYVSRVSDRVDILPSALAAIPAGALGLVALGLARGIRRRAMLTLGGLPGAGTAGVGRALGFLGVYSAVTAGLAVAFYALLALSGK